MMARTYNNNVMDFEEDFLSTTKITDLPHLFSCPESRTRKPQHHTSAPARYHTNPLSPQRRVMMTLRVCPAWATQTVGHFKLNRAEHTFALFSPPTRTLFIFGSITHALLIPSALMQVLCMAPFTPRGEGNMHSSFPPVHCISALPGMTVLCTTLTDHNSAGDSCTSLAIFFCLRPAPLEPQLCHVTFSVCGI